VKIPEEMRKPNNDLDAAIADVGRILDYLRNYRNILQTGDCNNCAIRGKCKYCPKPGQMVRYNCPHYMKGC
jgi:hypothetical protein